LGPLTSTLSIPFVITCPKLTSGALLCNPDGISWTSFYPLDNSDISGLASSSQSSFFSSSDPPAGFCSVGHTGRLCSRCATGYFPSGRICVECAASGWNVLILAANLVILIALVAYLYLRSPSAAASRIQAAEYRVRSSLHSDSSAAAASNSSPLKLLVFHCQQLSILLQTMSSQPPVLSSFLSFTSSSSTGFSLSSLLALECFDHQWGLQERAWLGVLAMAGILVVAGASYAYGAAKRTQRRRRPLDEEEEADPSGYAAMDDPAEVAPSSSSSAFAEMSLEQSLTIAPADTIPARSSHTIYRVYGCCLSLLYFFLFPCLQTALSGLACTDSRQYDPSAPGGVGDSLYLNLHPWQACDSDWRSSILPPALLGTILWLVAFPIGSTVLFQRVHRYLTHAGSQHTSVWPLCADLLAPYKPSLWYYEQILLVRRILLVAAVTLIPSTSLYLPLVLFVLIQLSAFLQHRLQPYASDWLNRGELISLYLLLINYITALVLQSASSSASAGDPSSIGSSITSWAIVLFLVNAFFIVALVIGLFASVREKVWTIVRRILAAVVWSTEESKSPARKVEQTDEPDIAPHLVFPVDQELDERTADGGRAHERQISNV
jgi:hypothetical protein